MIISIDPKRAFDKIHDKNTQQIRNRRYFFDLNFLNLMKGIYKNVVRSLFL